MLFVTASTPNPALQDYDVIEGNAAQSNAETRKCPELVAHVLSPACQELL